MKERERFTVNQDNISRIYALSPKGLFSIVIYYVVLFLFAMILFGMVIYWEYENKILGDMSLSIIGSASASLLGSVIYYIRKIYLIGIFNSIKSLEQITKVEKIGTILYFFIRPLFSMVMSVVIIIGLSVGIFSFLTSAGTLNSNFINFSMVISFFLGISNGTLMDKLNTVGITFINKIIG